MAAGEQLLTGLKAHERARVLVARDHLCVPTLRNDLLDAHGAFFRALLMAHKCAFVSVVTQDLLAVLGTLVFLVLGVVGVANTRADMAAVKAELARQHAAALRSLLEVFCAGCFYLTIGVILTGQGQGIADLVLLSQLGQDVAPQCDSSQHRTVANAVETFLCARQGYTDPVGNVQKADLALPVTADQRQQDDVVLFSLVFVHDVNSDPSELTGWHKLAQTLKLGSIGGEDGNLLWIIFLKEKIAAEGHDEHSLVSVLVAFSIFAFVFKVVVLHKEQTAGEALELKGITRCSGSYRMAFNYSYFDV